MSLETFHGGEMKMHARLKFSCRTPVRDNKDFAKKIDIGEV